MHTQEVRVNDPIGQPAYRRIAAALRTRIVAGDLKVGDAIPSTAKLCAEFAVSATAARAAVSELRNEGIVRGQPGKAVYVVATPSTIEEEGVNLVELASGLDGVRTQIRAVEQRVEAAPEEISELRSDVSDLRKQIATLQTHLMDLYARTGHNYPRSQDAGEKRTSREVS